MGEVLRPVVRTLPTRDDYVRAVLRGWHLVGDGVPLEQSIGVLYAQYMIETGGKSCFGWNLGNVKHVAGDGHDFHMLSGVWEGVAPDVAERLITTGQAVADASANHAAAVGPSRVSVVFQPPHPATWFRAFDSLDEGMGEHLQLLAKRFAKAWPAVLEGSVDGFARALHDQHYFTADPGAYAAGMRAPFAALVASSTYEDMIATMHEAPSEAYGVELDGAMRYDWTDDLPDLASLAHQGASGLIVDDLLDAYRRGDT